MKVGYLGPEGLTYGYMAARKYFDGRHGVKLLPHAPQPDICTEVRRGTFDRGVVAIENVIDGAVFEVVRPMKTEHGFGVRVCGEVTIPIEVFPFRAEAREDLPRVVVSHGTALRQCSRYVSSLEKQGVSKQIVSSTGEAALQAKDDPTVLALGPVVWEETLGLIRLSDQSVADDSDNFTRFWVIGRGVPSKPTGKDKTAILVSLTRDAPGGLYRSLAPFAERKINLCFLFPIPIPKTQWEYTFLIEFEAHEKDPLMEEALEELMRSGALTAQVLGSFPNTATYS